MSAANGMPGRTVPVDLALRAVAGEALTLTATDGENTVTVTGETVAEARTRAAEESELIRSLEKTGDTVFVPRRTQAETRNAFVPVSRVNAIRREALEALAEARIRAFAPDTAGEGERPEAELPEGSVPPTALVRTREQAEAARREGFRIAWYPEDYRETALERLAGEMREGDWFRLPDVCEEETLQMLHRFVCAQKEKLGGVVLGTVGQLGLDRGHRDCRMCDEGAADALSGQALEDRRGYRFPLLRQRMPEGCLVQLMNALPTDNLDRKPSNRAVELTTEDPEETEEVLNAFREGRRTGWETTAGHWKRPVE